ncbi:uncharacterized protein PWA37_002856 [Arxiozyma heterogenica]|uniref:Uncharacterized protein n=1 Tax=Arxiozyma heterogenica TaxID=278026 RepID=A0AAN7ZX19_9SACH|nr:hypothetical protein RI543_004438 [Kazachstania heterogenica]
MLALVVLPLMATASYLSKREDAKYQKMMKEAKSKTIPSTKANDLFGVVVPSVSKHKDVETNEHGLSVLLNTKLEKLVAASGQYNGSSRFSANSLTSKIFKDVDCDMNLTPYSKLALMTGIGIDVKYPIILEEHNEEINSLKNKVSPDKKFKLLPSIAEFSNLLPPLLSKLQLIENCHQFEKYTSTDPVLLNSFIHQHLNEIIWMGIYYSMNYTNFISSYPIDAG